MDTNSNIPPQKKVISVEILHLDEAGYGPQGKHTRREWRKACLDNLLAGADAFKAWQDSWKEQINTDLPSVSFAAKLSYDDDTQLVVESAEDYEQTIPYALDFAGHQFEAALFAKDVEFQQIALFAGATFSGYAIFSSATFNRNAYFSSATFSGDVTFSLATFSGNAFFIGTTFSGFAAFVSATFSLDAYFSATFSGDAHFFNAKFSREARFSSATISGNAFFNSSTFGGMANFSSSKFSGYTAFSSATVSGMADFSIATFSGTVDFSIAKFSGDANFSSATFSGDAVFTQATFRRQCRFDNKFVTYTKEWTKETSFGARSDFENAVFKNVGHFERVQFLGQIPSFLGVDTATTRLEFSGDEYFPEKDTSEDAIKRIGQLKRLADEHGQIDQALMFNAFELNAKRARSMDEVNNLKWWQKLFNGHAWLAWTTYAYDKLSDYGRSFTRPLLAYGVLMLVTLVLALGHGLWASMDACEREGWNAYEQLNRDQVSCPVVATVGEQKIPLTVPRAAFEYTAYRASGVLDFVDADKQTIAVANRLFNQPIEPMWMRIWGVAKAIASAALLFLAALGLRNKYRIK